MTSKSRFKAIYKVVDDVEIDTEIHLPDASSQTSSGYPVIIDIHGGAFMLGASAMVNQDQIKDCLGRGWIVVVPNHRLCPQVNLLEGPMEDCRDLLAWIYDGGLESSISNETTSAYPIDHNHVFAFGTSSGGTLALSLGFGVLRPVAGIFDMYGPCNFSAPFWTSELPHVRAKLPSGLTSDFLDQVYSEKPIPIRGGVSLEGQASGPPDFTQPRQAFAFTQIANGTVFNAIFPSKEWVKVDPLLNITPDFPPTFIVHGQKDTMVPIDLSRDLFTALQKSGVKVGMREIPDEEHTFAAKMQVGSKTWELHREGFDFLECLIHN